MKLTLVTDGASRGNPGIGGVGIIVIKKDKIIYEYSAILVNATNNVAEYMALHMGLSKVIDKYPKAKEIRHICDSQLVVNQMNGKWQVKNNALFDIKKMIDEQIYLNNIKITHEWKSRTDLLIEKADKLANESINEYLELEKLL